MKKYRVITIVSAIIGLALACYLAIEYEFLLGFNYPSGQTLAQRNAITHAIIYDSFLKLSQVYLHIQYTLKSQSYLIP
jgi:hypothetical protein